MQHVDDMSPPAPIPPGGATVSARPAFAPRRRSRPRYRATMLGCLIVLTAILGTVGYSAYRIVQDDSRPFAQAHFSRTQPAAWVVPPPPPPPPPPPVLPVQYLEVTPEKARAINAAMPFSRAPNPPAAPVSLSLPPLDDARAVDCLAAAAWYEAGDDAAGEQAVVQVVLNRMRHRAFPQTICGVVFEGSERATGCQFSFTCDGSMRRTPSAVAWRRAQNAAIAGMHGLVFALVGYATHYHTDWVVPNWSASVDKIAQLRTHLFYRWRGANGTRLAFGLRHIGSEPLIPALARLSAAHRPGSDAVKPGEPASVVLPGVTTTVSDQPTLPNDPTRLRGNQMQHSETGLTVIAIKPGEFSGTLALIALDLCKASVPKACTVIGFLGTADRVATDPMGRISFPGRQPDFYYFSDKSRGRETVYWNCAVFPRGNPAQCLPANFTSDR